ncbi:MAG: hydrolase, partial [Acidobacteria bacterium]|nr:hydrolase [Acidobacteriota bacterium]
IYIGAKFVEDLNEEIKNFPLEKKKNIIHLILSHQGFKKDGFGSPVDPSTPEAVFFHYLDNLDAKTRHILSALKSDDSEELFIKT